MEIYMEFPLDVTYDAYPFRRGTRDSYGCPMEPDEESYVEITDVLLNNHSIIEYLSGNDLKAIITQVEEYLSEEVYDYNEER